MYTDARKIENGSLIEGDICIVGAGPSGISMAMQWLNSPYKVILLEGGGFEYENEIQDLYAGKNTGQKYYPLRSSRLHYFGGTSNHWAGMCSTFDEIDFEKRDWVAHSGWPIKRADLDPFYERAQDILDLGPYEYGLDYWMRKDPTLTPLPLDNEVVWHKLWQTSRPTRFGDKYKDALIKSRNVHLYTYANVTEINANEKVSQITSVTIKNHAGKQHTVKAKHFVLACCSIQNARLLLSSHRQASKGLGNDNDNVGRYFMEHLEIKTGELWMDQVYSTKLFQWEFGVNNPHAELAIHPQKQREHKILNGTSAMIPLEIFENTKPAIQSWNSEDPRKAMDSLLHSFQKGAEIGSMKESSSKGKAFELFTRIEQAPNPASRVTIENETDALGMPRASLHWELTSLEKTSIRKIQELIGQQVGLAGIGRVKLLDYLKDPEDMSWPDFTGGGWHHMGTTRMSDDPKNGVVDANCKVHTLENLFVAGSACYTTAAAVTPTLTVVAISLRLSDHLKQRMATEVG